ncbi:hypothetical protein [Sphingobium sp. D43FB]|nr:hypothetical protein [Sphingobium sp. D43FB]
MAEHKARTFTNAKALRTVISILLDRLPIGPFNVSYHLEHHLFPSSPA